MEIIEDELDAAARMKSLADAPGERREFGYIQLRGCYHVMQTRLITAQHGIRPLARYRNQSAMRARPLRTAL